MISCQTNLSSFQVKRKLGKTKQSNKESWAHVQWLSSAMDVWVKIRKQKQIKNKAKQQQLKGKQPLKKPLCPSKEEGFRTWSYLFYGNCISQMAALSWSTAAKQHLVREWGFENTETCI